jgi:alpha-glucosidase
MRIVVLLMIAWVVRAQSSAPIEVRSPDGRIVVQLEAGERLLYRVSFQGSPRILDSGLGLIPDGAATLASFLRVEAVRKNPFHREWRPVYGERSVIPDRYNQAEIDLKETIPPNRRLTVIVRAYDEGVAFRYRLGGGAEMAIAGEATEFALPTGALVWETHGTQSTYRRVSAGELQPNTERPLLVEFPGGGYGAIAEAGMSDYSTMLLSGVRRKPGVLGVSLAGPVRLTLPAETPWRVILLADRPGQLLEHNYLLQNLCPPSRIQDTSWIRPGKVLREVTLSTKGAHEAVDFAARRGLRYIEFDAGWYGHEYSEDSDATRVSVDPLRLQKDPAYQGLDLPEVIRYAKSKGIGVLLYVNRRAMERQLDQILPLFEQWGVSGVKYGFVNVGSQQWTRWLYRAVEKAAAHHLMVDIHDEFRPTGMSRTWPNLLTQEGIRGNEEFPDATHNTVMPFTRFLAGAADYTICWTDQRLKNSAAHQLALSVVYYSPFQFVYWYDRPSKVKEDDPALAVLDQVPTVWDETRVLDGQPGEFAVVARRSGQRWFVGAITNTSARTVTVNLDFLPAGRPAQAKVFRDGATARQVEVETTRVDASSKLELKLAPSGGAAVVLN